MKEKGQALIILIVAIAVALTVLSAAIMQSVGAAKISATSTLGEKVYFAAESGAEYGLIKLMRDPDPINCNGADSLNQDGISIQISYSYNALDSTCVITSQSQKNNLIKKIRVEASYNPSQIFQYCCWRETF